MKLRSTPLGGLLRALASLRLTVVLLAFSAMLIFLATMALVLPRKNGQPLTAVG